MTNFFIDILACGAVLSGIAVITQKNPVISVIFLIALFVNAAGYLILTGIGFIGISYILLYIGAITVLFLFVIMMINIKLTDILETRTQYNQNFPLAFAIGCLFIYEMSAILPFSFKEASPLTYFLNSINYLNTLFLNNYDANSINLYTSINPDIADSSITNFMHIQSIGQGLYTYGASLLILCSMILLLSMIAPIFISRKSNKLA